MKRHGDSLNLAARRESLVKSAALWSGVVTADVFVAKASGYDDDLASIISAGLEAAGVSKEEISGKRILLKPNLVEAVRGAVHINTHPLVVRAAAEAFRNHGAAEIVVGEGPGHCRDTLSILQDTGLLEILRDERIRFVDLNDDEWYSVPNTSRKTRLRHLVLPRTLRQVDWVVSMPKLKTHHWAGVTLSMKNLFGVMPGNFYGWPKNVFHFEGIEKSIIDITTAVRAHFAIVDGIVGMQGDGPIMGTPKDAGVIVMGRDLVAVDVTCSRLMGINPQKVSYLSEAGKRLGQIQEQFINQRGEELASVRSDFELVEAIEAHRELRLT